MSSLFKQKLALRHLGKLSDQPISDLIQVSQQSITILRHVIGSLRDQNDILLQNI